MTGAQAAGPPPREADSAAASAVKALQAEGKTLLFEAQLGAGRDLIYGEYPWVTSSHVSGAYAGIGGGLPGLRPERVIAVAKAFSPVHDRLVGKAFELSGVEAGAGAQDPVEAAGND